MARAGANGLGTITNLEKMAAFLKVSYCARFMVKKESQTENGRLVPSTIGRHIPFCTLGFKACTIGENSA